MFRKPKKNPKAKFRSRKRTSEDDNGDGDHGEAETAKRQRNSEESTADDEHASTSAILEQIKNEHRQKNRPSRSISNKANGDSQNRKGFLQEFSSSDKPSDKDLATRTAEHHPQEQSNGRNSLGNKPEEGDGDKKLYKGTTETRNKFLAGPLKAPTFVRTTSRFDYQPDICKDYKDTGFCGFGDTCIYLHDRGDTLTGWQLEEEYAKKKKLEQDAKEREMDVFCRIIEGGDKRTAEDDGASGETGTSSLDALPFACHICRQSFTDPVVTTCNHYFCQKCIMEHVKTSRSYNDKSSACPICQKDTYGVFNYPTKLYQKRRRMRCSTWEEFASKSSGG